MQMIKRISLAVALIAAPLGWAAPSHAQAAAAPAVTSQATATPAAEPTAPTTAAAPAAAGAAATSVAAPASATATPADPTAATTPAPKVDTFPYAVPQAGVGQPVQAGMDFQPQVTANGQFAHWMNNAILMPMMFGISLLVLGLLLWIIARYRARANPTPSKTSHNTLIEVIWTLVPVLILVGISVPSIDLLARQYAPPPRDAVTIKVTGYQWYWGYEYPDHGIGEYVSNLLPEDQAKQRGEPFLLAVDNRMVVPVGRTVKLIVTGSDVIHSWAVPSLWTKMDAVPGRLNEVTFRAERTGVYYGQCSELCGINHGYMPIAVEVVTPERFAQWVASKGGQMPCAATANAATTPNAPQAGANDNAAVPGVAVENPDGQAAAGAAASQGGGANATGGAPASDTPNPASSPATAATAPAVAPAR